MYDFKLGVTGVNGLLDDVVGESSGRGGCGSHGKARNQTRLPRIIARRVLGNLSSMRPGLRP
jgi:hypothetical protein